MVVNTSSADLLRFRLSSKNLPKRRYRSRRMGGISLRRYDFMTRNPSREGQSELLATSDSPFRAEDQGAGGLVLGHGRGPSPRGWPTGSPDPQFLAIERSIAPSFGAFTSSEYSCSTRFRPASPIFVASVESFLSSRRNF